MPQHPRFAWSSVYTPGTFETPPGALSFFFRFLEKEGGDFPLSHPLRNSLPAFHTVYSLMKTILSLSPAAQLETECLVAVVLDRADNDKAEAFVSADKSIQQAAADLISGGDITGKTFEVA